MEIIIIGLIVFAGFRFFRYTTRAGAEAVRAFVFLEMQNKGMNARQANLATSALLEDLSSYEAASAVNTAKLAYQHLHDGKQLPMIGYAYSQGMTSTMPFWYRSIASSAPVTYPIEALYVLGRNQAEHQRETMAADEGYQKFYSAYANEYRRLSRADPNETTLADLWDREPLYEAYREGLDPLYVAAQACDERNQTKETFENFESYHSAFLRELARYAHDAQTFEQWAQTLDLSGVRTAFAEVWHPRRAAYGYYRFKTRELHGKVPAPVR